MKYQKNIFIFGQQLLLTGDLDPVYIALHSAEKAGHIKRPQMLRWLGAYLCYYHVGAASYLSEFKGQEFWDQMRVAAINEEGSPIGGRWPRASERRHFRGKAAIDAVSQLTRLYRNDPEQFIANLYGDLGTTFGMVRERVQAHTGFGPWAAFKAADLIDRVLGVPVSFNSAAVFMFNNPYRAALMQWESDDLPVNQWLRDDRRVVDSYKVNVVAAILIDTFQTFSAPPRHDRAVGMPEVETILCKWKSAERGRYHVGKDIDEIRHAADEWSEVSATARRFEQHVPEAVK